MSDQDVLRIAERCSRSLTGHYQQRLAPQQALAELAGTAAADQPADLYGKGPLIEEFEQRIAELLGKQAAVFMPSGTMCQQIALRIWSERKGTNNVAFHPTCHLEIHEHKGYAVLHNLHGVLVGDPRRLITLDDLQALRQPLAALLLELPQREIGGQLPTWEELTALTAWAREQGIALHMDGARLWECGPFYQRDYAEIAALFDTVYVSFYKGLGGLAGALLAGPPEIIAEAKIWQRRHGGNLIRLYPYVLSAQLGLEQHLPRMGEYHQKAREVAQVLASFAEIEVVPDPPHTNMFHAYIRGDAGRLKRAALAVADESDVWLFYRIGTAPLPNYHKVEFTMGDASLDLSAEEIERLIGEVLRRAA